MRHTGELWNRVLDFFRAPPQRASGDVCFLLTTSMASGPLQAMKMSAVSQVE